MKPPPLRTRIVIAFVAAVALLVSLPAVADADTAGPNQSQALRASDATAVASTTAVAAVSLRTLTRPYIVGRAQAWIKEQVPYSESRWHSDAYGSYRTDCSGYVSMAWALPTSYVTWTLPQIALRLSSFQLPARG